MELLRIVIAGNVDDGKSTLTGRLFYDAKQLLADQISTLELMSQKKGLKHIDFALLTDGLKEERIQGITIDVAYRYLNTARRKYILADSPGHIQYTRNFVTACSKSDLALLMVDVENGVVEQTRRHTYIASMMGISNIVFCINKMDIVGYSEDVFNSICNDIQGILSDTNFSEVSFIPVSALMGDNIVTTSGNMEWYKGKSLLDYLDNIQLPEASSNIPAIMPIQVVIRATGTTEHKNYRAYAGRVAAGTFRKGDSVQVYPTGIQAEIVDIDNCGRSVAYAESGMSASLVLSKDLDVARGDIIVHEQCTLDYANEIKVIACWLDAQPLHTGKKYIVRHATRELKCAISEVCYKVDINEFIKSSVEDAVGMNDIACLKLTLSSELYFTPYSINKTIGGLILIDPVTQNTVAACTIL